jgi:hypothetical protein
MLKRKNLIWIVIDSVRSYRTGLDDRDRLDIMDEFALESVEFLNAIASAPSTILSGAAMFTGMPSCFVSRHFDDWQFDPKVLISLQEIVSGFGYANYGIYNSKEDREVMRDLLRPIAHRYFPKGVSHGQHWTNNQVNLILESALKAREPGPSFFMLWYDSRNDPMVSEIVKRGLQLFKDFGLYDDSIILMTSDHGYPDPRSGVIQTRGEKYKRHDMVVTDDNIRVPLLIKYPGCKPHKVHQVIGLIDLFPTLLSLLDIKINDPRMKNVQGRNLFPLLDDGSAPWEVRAIRTDTRLSLAPGRITSLRTDKYKYVFYHDESSDSLFSLEDDPMELNDLLQNPFSEVLKIRADFHDQFEKMQSQLDHFHIEELEAAFEKNVRRVKDKNVKRLLVMIAAPTVFLSIITKSFRRKFSGISIDILVSQNDKLSSESNILFDHIISIEETNSKTAKKEIDSGRILRYDIALVPREKSNADFDDPTANKAAKVLGKKVLFVTYNMKFYNWYIAQWLWPIRKYWRNWEFYKHEPWLLLSDIIKLAKNGLIYFVLKNRMETPKTKIQKDLRDKFLLAEKERMAMKVKKD